MSMVPFNINENVRVRLKDRGHAILKARHDDLLRRWPQASDYVPPKVDADGWSQFQLWSLMEIFGPHMFLGGDPPFETTIEFKSPDEIRLKIGLRYIQGGGLWGQSNEDAFRNIRTFAGRVADGMTSDEAFEAKIAETAMGARR